MNQDELLQDEQLAAFTDALLEGPAMGEAEDSEKRDLPPLADTVVVLARALGRPQSPPARLRRQIHRQVAAEWCPQRPSLIQRLLQPFRQPTYRRAWAAIAVMIVAGLAATLLLPADATQLPGTAAGEPGAAILAIVFVLGGILLVAWLVSRRAR